MTKTEPVHVADIDPRCARIQVLSVEDAVLAVGIHRFATRCARLGQPLTPLAAEKIAAMAAIIGVRVTPPTTSEHDWSEADLHEAMQVVEESGSCEHLQRLDTLLADLTVADVEGYCEP